MTLNIRNKPNRDSRVVAIASLQSPEHKWYNTASICVHDGGKIIRWCDVQVAQSHGSNKDHVNSLWAL